MERKNTMLLTVIAVATLLVAVVGATFAYYSVTSANNNSTASLNTSTPEVGSVSLTSTSTPMYLNMTGDQMADTEAAKGTYYHTESASSAPVKGTASPTNVAQFTVTGSDNNTNYHCTFNMNVTTADNGSAGASYTAFTGLTQQTGAEDIMISFSTNTDSGSTPTFTTLPSSYTLTQTAVTNGVTVTGIEFDVLGNTNTYVTATASFNTANRVQNSLAQLSVQTTVTLSNLSCTTGQA